MPESTGIESATNVASTAAWVAGAVVAAEQQRRGWLLCVACERIDRTGASSFAVGDFSDKRQVIETPRLERFVSASGPEVGAIAHHAVNRPLVRRDGEDFLTRRRPSANAPVSSRGDPRLFFRQPQRGITAADVPGKFDGMAHALASLEVCAEVRLARGRADKQGCRAVHQAPDFLRPGE